VPELSAARRWPTDAASKARLDMLGLFDTGEVRVRVTEGYEWEGAYFRPEFADAPAKGRIFCDPDDVRSIVVTDHDGPSAGCSGGPATLRGYPLDTPIPLWLLRELRAQQATGKAVGSGAKRITELLAEADGITLPASASVKGPQGKRRATRIEKALRAAEQNGRGHALPADPPPLPTRDTESDDELIYEEESEGAA
jgi:hypothetical protein